MLSRPLVFALFAGAVLASLARVAPLRGAEEKQAAAANAAADAETAADDAAAKKKAKGASKKATAAKKKGAAANAATANAANGSSTTNLTNGGFGGVAGAATFGLPGGIQAVANAAAANAAAGAATTGTTTTGTSPFTADSSTTTSSGATSNSTAGQGTNTGLAQNLTTLIDLTNQERRKQDLQELTVDPLLMKMARDHSANMAKQNIMSHELNGVTFQQRLDQSGYKASTAGENIAAGQSSPAEAVAAWMKSPGHRANILNANFTQIGVGISKSSAGILYYTQDFGTPLDTLTTNPVTDTTSNSTDTSNSTGTTNGAKRSTTSK